MQSLQRSKSNISIITNQLSTLHSTCDTIVLFILRVKVLKFIFQRRKKVIRKGSKSIPNQGVKVRTSTFKISNKVETNSKDRDIVWMKIPRFIEQGFYDNSKTLRRPISN